MHACIALGWPTWREGCRLLGVGETALPSLYLEIRLVERRNTNHRFETRGLVWGLQETGSSGAFGQSVDGLEESGCGTGRWMFPRWNWVTDAKIRPFSAGAGEACMNGWQQGRVVLLVQPKWISSPSMFLCFRLDAIMHSNIKAAWTMQINCQWLKFLWVSAETFQEF